MPGFLPELGQIVDLTVEFERGRVPANRLQQVVDPVVRPLDNPLLEEDLARRRTRFGNRVIAKRDAAREILRAMRRNETVAILVDQNVIAEEAVFVPFFGRLAATNPSLALLQMKTDAAVVHVSAGEGALQPGV